MACHEGPDLRAGEVTWHGNRDLVEDVAVVEGAGKHLEDGDCGGVVAVEEDVL